MRHGDAEGGVDRLMTDPESEDEVTAGGIGDEGCPLRTGVGVAQIDVGDPGSYLDATRGGALQLSGGHHIIVDLGGEDGAEASRLGFLRDRLDLGRAPTRAGNYGQSKSLRQHAVLSVPVDFRTSDLGAAHPTPLDAVVKRVPWAAPKVGGCQYLG